MSTRRLLLVAGCAALVLAVVAGVRHTREVGARLTAGRAQSGGDGRVTVRFVQNPQPVPPFESPTLDGATLRTADWTGQVTLLNFWATWCPPCRAEIPDLVALQDKYRGRLQVISIADDASADVVRRFAAEHGINYPIALATPAIKGRFAIRAIPTSYLLDREGRVVQKHVGLVGRATIENEIRVLLGELPDAVVETFEDQGQVLLANAAHATEIPGIDLTALDASQRTRALQRLNTEGCDCGCGLTLAECRINDPDCTVSLPLAKQVIQSMTGTP